MMETEESLLPAMTQARRALDGVRLIRRQWWVLAVAAFLGVAAGYTYYCLAPKSYQAEIMIVPKQSPARGLGGLGALAGGLADLPFDAGGLPGLGSSDAERIMAILHSRSTTDAVIKKFDLLERYESGNIETARKQVWSHCEAKVERKPNVVILACEDEDPATARDMAEYFGKAGDDGFRRIATSSASEERKFLEKRAAEARRELDVASMALRQFQETHKIIDLPEQSKAVVSAMAALEGDLISKRIQLSYLSGFVSNDESSATQLGRQIAVLRKELETLEQRRAPRPESAPVGSAGTGTDIFPPAMDVPALRYQLEALFREQKIRETVFFLLTERYESLKVDEARDLSSFVIFDHAVTPTYRFRPRLRVVPIGLMGGLLLGFMVILIPSWWRDLLRRAALERTS